MNMPNLKEGGNPQIVAITGVVIAGIFGLFTAIYSSQINAQSNELREHDKDIAQLKIAEANAEADQRRSEQTSSTIVTNLSTILSEIRGLKDSNEAFKEQAHVLQQKFDEFDLIMRPLRSGSGH